MSLSQRNPSEAGFCLLFNFLRISAFKMPCLWHHTVLPMPWFYIALHIFVHGIPVQ